jgi:roadblock/LC7 domain-containing protein
MDRDELQDRIRARRSGSDPYRRGGSSDQSYQRFEPEPDDALARREPTAEEPRPDYYDAAAAAAAREAERVEAPPPDLTRDRDDDWVAPAAAGAAAAAAAGAARDDEAAGDHGPVSDSPVYEQEPAPAGRYDSAYDAQYDDDEAGAYPYEYDNWEERRPRSSGAGAFAILGFLALGVLALLGGAVLAGVFSDDPGGVAQESPTPSVAASLAPQVSEAPSVAPSAGGSAEPGGSDAPLPTGEPVVFDDGAVFEVQACATNEMSFDGCAQEAEFFSGGSFVVWVGFQGASGDDTVLVVLRQDGAAVADSEFVLGNPPFGCSADCGGYARQGFTGLTPGEYTVELLRNGEPAHAISIGVD